MWAVNTLPTAAALAGVSPASDNWNAPKDLDLTFYVKHIFILENRDSTKKSLLSFFADSYPGIIFQQSDNGAFLHPGNKKLSNSFLYGQRYLL